MSFKESLSSLGLVLAKQDSVTNILTIYLIPGSVVKLLKDIH